MFLSGWLELMGKIKIHNCSIKQHWRFTPCFYCISVTDNNKIAIWKYPRWKCKYAIPKNINNSFEAVY